MLVWQFPQYTLFFIASAYVAHGVIWYLLGFLRPSRRLVNNE
jgi:hypothetical protein